MKPITFNFPTREEFIEQFDNVDEFLAYVRTEPGHEDKNQFYSVFLYMDDFDKIAIEERWDYNFFPTTKHIIHVESWEYACMDWFTYVTGIDY